MELAEHEDVCNTAENIGFDDLNACSMDLLDQLVNEWNLDRPPMYQLEDSMSILTHVAPLSDASDATTMAEEEKSLRTTVSGPKSRPRQTRSLYVIDEEPAITGRPGKESAYDEAKSMYVMDKGAPLLTFEAVGEAKSEYYWPEEVAKADHNGAAAKEQQGSPINDKTYRIPFTARNVTSANVAQSSTDQHHTAQVERDRLFNLLLAYQNLSQTSVVPQ